MAVIPLQIASRSLDTGGGVQYPQGGESGRAMQGAGNELQQIADHFKVVQDQQDRFDAGVVDDELRQRLAQTENDAVQNAPADGSGIHDSVYGQMDVNGRTIKPGAFDTLFDEYAQKVPESQRANFIATKEAMKLAGSNRLAGAQRQSRQAYEQVELTKSQDSLLNGILQSDPNDTQTFEAFKQNGLDRIAASGMSAIDKEKAAYNWNQSATKGLFQSMLEKDPTFAGKARAALGLAPPQISEGVVLAAGGPGGAARSGNLIQRGRGIADYYQKKGLSPIAAAGIAGAAMQENGGRFDGKPGDNGISHGGFQWNGARFESLKRFAASRGKEWTDGETQLDYVLWEMDNGDPGARRAGRELRAATTVEQAATAMMHFERPQGYSPDNPQAGHAYGSRLRFAQEVAGENPGSGTLASSSPPDPRFAGLSPDDRLSLANQADVQYRQQQAAEKAQATASYTAYKDRFELGIADGSIADPGLIHNDKTLNDGDKASLLRSFNEQNKGAIQLQGDLTALAGGSLSLDPYASEDKRRADNLYSSAIGKVPLDQQAGLATTIIQQTHVVPQPIINDMRRGLSSQNPAQVIAAAQTAQKIAAFDPAALGRRDGGSEVQKAADDFSYYVNKLNLPPEEAARRMIDNASPEKQRDRKALEPAAKEFVKTMGDVDLSSEFKDGGFFSGAPALGLDPAQEAGIKADFLAIAEDQFYSANGNADLAKNRALEQMKALYGVSRLSGAATVVKYPPERYWPKEDSAGGPLGIGADPFSYVRTQLFQDIGQQDETFQPGSMQLVTTPETETDVKAGRLPGYAVMWKDANGNLQTIPGKVWRPDVSNMLAIQQENRAKAQAEAEAAARQKDLEVISGRDRGFSADNMLNGNTQVYTPEMRRKFMQQEATQPKKPDPGANIPTDIPAPETSSGSAM